MSWKVILPYFEIFQIWNDIDFEICFFHKKKQINIYDNIMIYFNWLIFKGIPKLKINFWPSTNKYI